jgi:predicted membrane channel-forming protein YqfA (hemolysin III family)
MHNNTNVNILMFAGSQTSSACVLVTAALRRILLRNIGEITLLGVKFEVIGKHPVSLFTTYLTVTGPR